MNVQQAEQCSTRLEEFGYETVTVVNEDGTLSVWFSTYQGWEEVE